MKSVVVLPDPVGPTTTTAPNGCEIACSSEEWLRGDIPRASSESGASPCDSIRSVTFSPYVVGRVAMRTSIDSRRGLTETRPSCGMRALGDVEAAHDLEAADDGGRLSTGDRGELAHDTVDADANEELARLRREVDVGGPGVERFRDRPVDEDHGGRVVVEVEDVGASSSLSRASVTTSSIGTGRRVERRDRGLDRLGRGTQMRTGIPTASRSSSENMTLVGSATATRTYPSSRNRIGSAW